MSWCKGIEHSCKERRKIERCSEEIGSQDKDYRDSMILGFQSCGAPYVSTHLVQ